MDFIDITSENIEIYMPKADQWIKDNICRGRFIALCAYEDESVAGAIVYTIRKADGEESHIGVLYDLSGDDGVKRALLERYTMRCEGLGLEYTIVEVTDKEQAKFFEDYGFDMEESESINLVIEVSDLEKIEPFKKVDIPSAICPLSGASPIEFRYFLQEYRENVGLNPYFDIDATPMSWYDRDVSSICIGDDGIDAAFLLHYDGKGTLTTELLAGFGDKFMKKIPYLLACSAISALDAYTRDTKIVIRRDGRQAAKITEKILGGMKGEKAYHGILSMSVR